MGEKEQIPSEWLYQGNALKMVIHAPRQHEENVIAERICILASLVSAGVLLSINKLGLL